MNTVTTFTNVGTPRVGDYVFLWVYNQGRRTLREGFVIESEWIQESEYTQYTQLTILDVLKQARFQVKHTTFLDDHAPEGEINWFYGAS
jgi:signal peptidase I